MREIVIDTETTGLSMRHDRIVEIACIELVNRIPTGRRLHKYFNPHKPISVGAFRKHGLSNEFLTSMPPFAESSRSLATFIGTAALVAHNAPFDFGMLNNEFERAGLITLSTRPICTLALARNRWPDRRGKGAHDLDAVCTLLEIDIRHRVKHGAMLDAELVALAYPRLVSSSPEQRLHHDTPGDISLLRARTVADDPLRNRVIVACPHCSGRSRLSNGKLGAVSCPHCSKRYYANTI